MPIKLGNSYYLWNSVSLFRCKHLEVKFHIIWYHFPYNYPSDYQSKLSIISTEVIQFWSIHLEISTLSFPTISLLISILQSLSVPVLFRMWHFVNTFHSSEITWWWCLWDYSHIFWYFWYNQEEFRSLHLALACCFVCKKLFLLSGSSIHAYHPLVIYGQLAGDCQRAQN